MVSVCKNKNKLLKGTCNLSEKLTDTVRSRFYEQVFNIKHMSNEDRVFLVQKYNRFFEEKAVEVRNDYYLRVKKSLFLNA